MPAGVARSQDSMVASLDQVPAGFRPAAAVLAIKPQMAAAVLPALGKLLGEGGSGEGGVVVLSILAGLRAASVSALLGGMCGVVRAMPNTPASIGQGMTVAFAGPRVSGTQRGLCDALLQASGALAWLDDEELIDAATAVSGCGPAYVFLLAELLEQQGTALGLPPKLARMLARRTVAGAGALLEASAEESAQLRRNVTSPNGVTERALGVLMAADAWPRAVAGALHAAAARSRELGA